MVPGAESSGPAPAASGAAAGGGGGGLADALAAALSQRNKKVSASGVSRPSKLQSKAPANGLTDDEDDDDDWDDTPKRR